MASDTHIVVKNISKGDQVKLYDQYLRNKTKPGRDIYDSLMVAAKDCCPYCGGVGRPNNLDHYLPKARFPQFSVVPLNLVPACRDCNMGGKREVIALQAGDQVVHPYLDKKIFFCEQWIYARVNQSDPLTLTYYTKPPQKWTSDDRKRVESHFRIFNLKNRFSVQAASELETVLSHRRGSLRSLSANDLPAICKKRFLLLPPKITGRT